MKKGMLWFVLLFVILLVGVVIAGDVGYIYRKSYKVDDNVVDVLEGLGLGVDLIDEKDLGGVNFDDYQMIFVGDERFLNEWKIPVNEVPSVIANYYFGGEFGLTDVDGVSSLASNSPLNVKKDNHAIQVYTQGKYNNFGGPSIPYYYLSEENKAPGMEKVAGTFLGNDYDLGDVISYADAGTHLINGKSTEGKLCFFGLSTYKNGKHSSDFWTPAARDMFEECVEFVAMVCEEDSECGDDGYVEEEYCIIDDVYQDYEEFECLLPGSVDSSCNSDVNPVLIEECAYSCAEGVCFGECNNDTECSDDYDFNYCDGDDVYQEIHDFGCEGYFCSENVSNIFVEACDDLCVYGECVDVECYSDSECDDVDDYTYDDCVNPGTVDSYCEYTPIICLADIDCGITGFIGDGFCSSEDVFQNYIDSDCVNPGEIISYCDIQEGPELVEDCGEDYCDLYGAEYCIGDDVYHNRDCYDVGCLIGDCFSDVSNEEVLVEACSYGCVDGECLPECSVDLDCGEDYCDAWGDNYCSNGDVYHDRTCHYYSCSSGECFETISLGTELVDECDLDCLDGECIDGVHDVGLIDFSSSINGVFLEYVNGTDITEENPVLSCEDTIKAKVKAKNFGNYIEDVDLFGDLSGDSFSINGVDNMDPGDTNLRSSLSPYISLDGLSGTYYVNVEASIIGFADDNLSNNLASREIEVVCVGECSEDIECGDDGYIGDEYCIVDDVYQDYEEFECLLPGTMDSSCSAEINPNLIETCAYTCVDGDCVGECSEDNDCSDDYSLNYCVGDDVWQEIHDFGCEGFFCSEDVDNIFVEACSYQCVNGACIDEPIINCYQDSDCGANGYPWGRYCVGHDLYRNYQQFTCNNPGTVSSSCSSSVIPQFYQDCGEDSWSGWSNDYCFEGNVYHDRNFLDRGCWSNSCDIRFTQHTELVEDCNYGCSGGECIPPEIECHNDADCGTDGYLGNGYCMQDDVFQNYKEFECVNPGAFNSYCLDSVSQLLVEDCAYDCADGLCFGECSQDTDCGDDYEFNYCKGNDVFWEVHDFICLDYICGEEVDDIFEEACDLCIDGECFDIECYTDSDCEDDEEFTVDTCENPGTVNSYCEHDYQVCEDKKLDWYDTIYLGSKVRYSATDTWHSNPEFIKENVKIYEPVLDREFMMHSNIEIDKDGYLVFKNFMRDGGFVILKPEVGENKLIQAIDGAFYCPGGNNAACIFSRDGDLVYSFAIASHGITWYHQTTTHPWYVGECVGIVRGDLRFEPWYFCGEEETRVEVKEGDIVYFKGEDGNELAGSGLELWEYVSCE